MQLNHSYKITLKKKKKQQMSFSLHTCSIDSTFSYLTTDEPDKPKATDISADGGM